ncbi:hypothetical protein GGR56DRAFT_498877 [Xylariaceae sp. FL0804]|nr:hypothetical protein GGR56DRAFT_498877 [Xylariaceae sp. FL0804]
MHAEPLTAAPASSSGMMTARRSSRAGTLFSKGLQNVLTTLDRLASPTRTPKTPMVPQTPVMPKTPKTPRVIWEAMTTRRARGAPVSATVPGAVPSAGPEDTGPDARFYPFVTMPPRLGDLPQFPKRGKEMERWVKKALATPVDEPLEQTTRHQLSRESEHSLQVRHDISRGVVLPGSDKQGTRTLLRTVYEARRRVRESNPEMVRFKGEWKRYINEDVHRRRAWNSTDLAYPGYYQLRQYYDGQIDAWDHELKPQKDLAEALVRSQPTLYRDLARAARVLKEEPAYTKHEQREERYHPVDLDTAGGGLKSIHLCRK